MTNKKKGIFYIILSALCFATMSLFVQLAGDVPFIQKTFFRNIISLVFSFSLIMKQGGDFSFKKQNTKFFILRSFFGTLGIFCNFYAIENLILSDAATIAKLSPFFVILFSFLILKEKIKLWQFTSIAIAFIGSLLIVNPGIFVSIFTGVSLEITETTFPALVCMLGALSAGVAYTMIRRLSIAGERGPFIVFFFSVFSTVVCLPFLIFGYTPMTLLQIMFLVLAGVFASFGQFTVTAAYSNAAAKDISIYDYSQIVFSAIYGFFVFGVIPPSTSVFGYIIIVSVAVFMYLKQRFSEKPNNKI